MHFIYTTSVKTSLKGKKDATNVDMLQSENMRILLPHPFQAVSQDMAQKHNMEDHSKRYKDDRL